MIYTDEKRILNPTGKSMTIWIEPWALEVEVPPGKTALFTADSETAGQFEVRIKDDTYTIYAWCGSSLKVTIDGEKVWDLDTLRVPELPEGVTVRNFVEMSFEGESGVV